MWDTTEKGLIMFSSNGIQFIVNQTQYWGDLVASGKLLPLEITLTLYMMIGNLLIILALWRYRYLQTPSNLLIGNLALSDVFGSLSYLPAIHILPDSLVTPACTVLRGLVGTWITVHFFSLLSIGVDRHIKMKLPLRYYSIMTERRSYIAVGSTWAYGLFMGGLMSSSNYLKINPMARCMDTEMLFFLLGYMQPVLVFAITIIFFCNTIWIGWRIQGQVISELSLVNHQAAVNFKKESKITQKLCILLLLPIVCHVPLLATAVMSNQVHNQSAIVIYLIAVTGIGQGFWIYAYADIHFREGVIKILKTVFAKLRGKKSEDKIFTESQENTAHSTVV